MPLKFQSRQIPQNPGVYFFKSAGGRSGGKILYIGKAANLRARIRSYFGNAAKPPLGGLAAKLNLSWEILSSEAEALIREAELIKRYRPRYNVLMRDDKQYFYVGFTKEKFPKIFIAHQKNRTANYIGPFTEGGVLRSALKTLRRAFPYCTCPKPHKRPCLNARIGRCLGYCCLTPTQPSAGLPLRKGEKLLFSSPFPLTKGEVDMGVSGYEKNIRAIRQILSGKNKRLARTLKKEMQKLSAARKYEGAGKIRDQIRALEKIFEHRGVLKQNMPTEYTKAIHALESLLKISNLQRIEAYDVANIYGKFAYGSMAVFIGEKPAKENYRLFKIKTVSDTNDPAMLKEVLERRFKHKEWPYPQLIIVDGGKAQLGAALAVKPPSKIIALTKNKKHVGDHIFIQNRREPISLDNLPQPLKNLILYLDSEAHRFAIFHYRKLHRKRLLT